MKADYWTSFWRDHGAKIKGADVHSQVLRTIGKQPIEEKRWNSTLSMVREHMSMTGGHRMLELCCGNGLFARHFAPDCDHLLAVDISPDLLHGLGDLGLDSVDTLESDIRNLDFLESSFDRILFYAALQYLSPAETVMLFERMAIWLEPGGILYVGDVPDRTRIWSFFNNDERQAAYFRNVRDAQAVVGTWYEQDWLQRLGFYAGFSEVRIIEQPPYMINHSHRYEVVLVR